MNTTLPDPYWYRNKALLQGAKQEFGSLRAAAEEIGGVDSSTLAKWWRKLGMEQIAPGPAPRPPKNQEALQRLYTRVYG